MYNQILFPFYKSVYFRITSPLRGLPNYDTLYPEYIYLCVNSTPCYLRPPLWGLKRVVISFHAVDFFIRITSPLWGHQNYDTLYLEYIYLCVNSTPCYLRPPLWGLKLHSVFIVTMQPLFIL